MGSMKVRRGRADACAGMGRAALRLWQGPRQGEIAGEKHDGSQAHLNTLRGPAGHHKDSQRAQGTQPWAKDSLACAVDLTEDLTGPHRGCGSAKLLPPLSQSPSTPLQGPRTVLVLEAAQPCGGATQLRAARLCPLELGHRCTGAQSSLSSPSLLCSGRRPRHPERGKGSDAPGTQQVLVPRRPQGGGRLGRHPTLCSGRRR